ncbi:O-antigen ligase family protein [Candidatus Planktophila dulcis]|uniref:O-antigen ligase family protein n=1 Tax=Candidatus Planktophila dulcis TaxID=1884914 RepID=UPI003CF6A3AC
MIEKTQEKKLAKFLAVGVFLISVTVMTEGFADPVNVPKFLILGVVALGSLGFLIRSQAVPFFFREVSKNAPLFLFLIFSLITTLKSSLPLSQNLYGSYGRNNGFFTYLFLSVIFICGSLMATRSNHSTLLKSLIYVGYVNLAYCLWVIILGDFVPWDNPYGNILGTFGNPNFIGAFLGIFFGVLLSFALGKEASKAFKISLIVILPLTIFEIVDSSAIQGRVLAALSIAIVGFFYVRFKLKPVYTVFYSTTMIAIGVLALAGALQRGPLTEWIYKTSVSLRGQYWLAAWNTGQTNPRYGVGMDGFGDWYRRSRDIRAIELPGTNTVVNAAHNVPLDMFAFGGWPLFISYLLVMALSFKSAVVIARRIRSYDAVAVGLITAWACYQLQSIISINQIGLAVWGWLLSGLLIGYEKHLKRLEDADIPALRSTNKTRAVERSLDAKNVLWVSALGGIGLLIALPPATADIKMRSAQVSQDAFKVEQTMDSSYFNPQNIQKYALNIQVFENSGLFDLSHKYTLQAIKWNPETYDFWRILYSIKNSTQEERDLAIQKMRVLDPLNPELRSTR